LDFIKRRHKACGYHYFEKKSLNLGFINQKKGGENLVIDLEVSTTFQKEEEQ